MRLIAAATIDCDVDPNHDPRFSSDSHTVTPKTHLTFYKTLSHRLNKAWILVILECFETPTKAALAPTPSSCLLNP